MDFRLLGPLEVVEHDRPLALGGAKQRSLLVVLLLHANEVVPTERLIDELWGGSPPATVAKSIQVYVSRLRREFGDGRIVTRTPGYMLRADRPELDLWRFERLVAEAGDADPAAAARKLREALALWRGPPLADLAYEPFAQAPIARLEELRLAALERRIDADLAGGGHNQLVGELEALIAEHPLRERLRGQLMLCLYRCDRQAEALEAYQTARTTLVEELGIEPGRALRELQSAILRQDPGLDAPRAAAAPSGALFIGRERELAELTAGVDDAFAGRGRLFLLAGEPGAGKSRLAEELAASAEARGARVLVGRCWEAGGAPAYWPWVQALRAYVRGTDAATLREQVSSGAADLVQILPELRDLLGDLPAGSTADPEEARFRLFDAACEFMRNACRERPIVLVLEDLHAADIPSLLMLRFVRRELGSIRLLVVCTFRDVDPVPGEELRQVLAEVGREPVATRLTLRGLTESEVSEYLELAASELASPRLAAALHTRTGGNPLFVGELVRLFSVEGVPEEPRLAIPPSAGDAIARRLTYVSDACSRLLLPASVLGGEFALDELAALGEVSEEELLTALDEATAARIVADAPASPGRMRFAHALIRDTLYGSLTSARRAMLHGRAVQALERLHGEHPGPHLAELARHAIAAGDWENGLRYARRAGDRAVAMLAHEEAARLYGLALGALERCEPVDAGERWELLTAAGDALARAGSTAEAKETFLSACELARRTSMPERFAHAALGYGGRSGWQRAGDDGLVVPLLEEALAAIGEEATPLRARVLARLAGALRDEPSLEPRSSLSREAVAIARRLGDAETLAYALVAEFMATWGPEVEPLAAIADEVTRIAARTGSTDIELDALTISAIVAWLTLADGAAALDERYDALAETLNQPAQQWAGAIVSAFWALLHGDFEQAERIGEAAWRLGDARRWDADCSYRLTLIVLRREQRRLAEIEDLIRESADLYRGYRSFRCFVPGLECELGDEDAARRTFGELAEGEFAALPRDSEWLFCLSLMSEVAARLDDRERAAVLYRLLEPYARVNAMAAGEVPLGPVARYLGIAAATSGRWEEAAAQFEDAIAMNGRIGARPLLAHSQHDYARMLLARGRPGDEARARELLADAAASFRELGMDGWAEAAPAPTPFAPDG